MRSDDAASKAIFDKKGVALLDGTIGTQLQDRTWGGLRRPGAAALHPMRSSARRV